MDVAPAKETHALKREPSCLAETVKQKCTWHENALLSHEKTLTAGGAESQCFRPKVDIKR